MAGIQGFMYWNGGGIIFLPWQPAKELSLQLTIEELPVWHYHGEQLF